MPAERPLGVEPRELLGSRWPTSRSSNRQVRLAGHNPPRTLVKGAVHPTSSDRPVRAYEPDLRGHFIKLPTAESRSTSGLGNLTPLAEELLGNRRRRGDEVKALARRV